MTILKCLHIVLVLFLILFSCKQESAPLSKAEAATTTISVDEERIINKANEFLNQEPVPITSFKCDRSAGGIHDFYSEGDYWWEDPENPEGSYIRKDGLSNPNNFLEHRKTMRSLSEWVSTLTAAFLITKDTKYAEHAVKHLRAFFIDPETLMNPNLLYAQAIKGRFTGRGIGIIDTIHLIEVARSIKLLYGIEAVDPEDYEALQKWFDDYATWMNTHHYGLDEKDHGNNHSTWWAAQLAAFADLSENEALMEVSRSQFRKLLSSQMDETGAFPEELDRTKPYNYSLFNLEGYAVLCHIASTSTEDLWRYEGVNGSIKKAWDFMAPYIIDKSSWIKPPDVSHFDEIPIQSVGLALAAKAYNDEELYRAYDQLDPTKKSEEVRRNFPLWYTINWIQ